MQALHGIFLVVIGLAIASPALAVKDEFRQDRPSGNALLAFLSAFNDATERGDLDALAARFAPNAYRKSPTGTQIGRAQIRAKYAGTLRGFPSFTITPIRLVSEGKFAVCQCRAVLIQKGTGKRVELDLAVMLTFDENGLVSRFVEYYDTAAFKRQLK